MSFRDELNKILMEDNTPMDMLEMVSTGDIGGIAIGAPNPVAPVYTAAKSMPPTSGAYPKGGAEQMMADDLLIDDDEEEDEDIADDQYKSPNRRHIRRQSAHPSSFGKSISFGGRGGKVNVGIKITSIENGANYKVIKEFFTADGENVIFKNDIIKLIDFNDKAVVDYDGIIHTVDKKVFYGSTAIIGNSFDSRLKELRY